MIFPYTCKERVLLLTLGYSFKSGPIQFVIQKLVIKTVYTIRVCDARDSENSEVVGYLPERSDTRTQINFGVVEFVVLLRLV